MSGRRALALTMVLPVIGAILGACAAPGLALTNPTVSLAARVRFEESSGLAERTKASEAFRENAGSITQLYADAACVRRQFGWGAALLGVWIGLVVACKVWANGRTRPVAVAVVDQANCVSCGRCYASCPRERVQWRSPAVESEQP